MSLNKLSLSLLLLLSTIVINAQWNKQQMGTNRILEKVLFTDSLTCYVAGQDGLIFRSTDGGNTWKNRNYLQPVRIYDLFFFDSLHGFACGDNGSIGETLNGGQTWSKKNLGTIDNNKGIYFYDSSFGLVVSDKGRIFSSSNGGASWKQDIMPFMRGMQDVVILSNGKCIAVGDTGMIMTRHVNDSAWVAQSSGTNITIRSIQFLNDELGYLAGGQFDPVSGYKNIFMFSNDSGKTWTQNILGFSKQINSIHFINKDTGFASCADGFLMKTTNGGSSWFKLSISSQTLFLNSVNFSGSKGIVVGDVGSLFRSENLGGYVVGQAQVPAPKLEVYPNPARDLVRISLGGATLNGRAELYDVSGRLVYAAHVNEAMLALKPSLEKGLYTLLIYSRSLPHAAAAKLVID